MSSEAAAKTPGTILREARESASLTLTDVAAMTRIPRTMLAHLEKDRFDEYSAEVFARGHLRNYARELRLDPETVIGAYERYTGKFREDVDLDDPVDAVAPRAARALRKRESALSFDLSGLAGGVRPTHIVAIGLVLVFLFVIVNFLTGSRATAKDPAQFPAADEQDWELEQTVEETRWALEQPAASPEGDQAAADLAD